MRAHFPALLLFAILLTACAPDRQYPIPPPKNEVPAHDLKGPVHTLHQTDSTTTDSLSPPRIVIREYTFNQAGQLTEAVHEVPGEARNVRTFAFDSLHRRVEYRNTSSENNYQEKETSIYADHGLVSERQLFNAEGELLERKTYSYTAEGKLEYLAQNIYTRREGQERKAMRIGVEYEYDVEGRLEWKRTDREGSPLMEERYEEGKLVETKKYGRDGDELRHRMRHSYTESSQSDSSFLPNGNLMFVETKELDEQGNVIRVVSEGFEPDHYSEVIYTYNEHGDKASQKEIYHSDMGQDTIVPLEMATLIFAYRYDEQGNWIRRERTRLGMVDEVTVREITYWE